MWFLVLLRFQRMGGEYFAWLKFADVVSGWYPCYSIDWGTCHPRWMEFHRNQAYVNMLKADRQSTYKCWAFVRTPWMCPLHWGLWAGHWGCERFSLSGTIWPVQHGEDLSLDVPKKRRVPKQGLRVSQHHPKLDQGFWVTSETSKYCWYGSSGNH